MVYVAACRRLRFFACAYGGCFDGLPFDSVRIGENQPAFIFCVRFQIQGAAGKHISGFVVRQIPHAVVWRSSVPGQGPGAGYTGSDNSFVVDAEKRERLVPLLLALLTVSKIDPRIPVIVARNSPFEPQRHKRRQFYSKFSRSRCGLRPRRRRDCQEREQET